ncbi:MAG: outer membrane beta-barrel protein [Bacteroidetes bacterium]|nr:outer membrane beta-barrel protein [Bacteroidota bacterium]
MLTIQDSLLLATKTNELLFDNDSASVNIKSDSSLTTPPPVTDSLNTKWSVEIMYGYDIIQNKFSAANGNQNYFNILNEQEKINNGFSMSLKVGYNLNPRLKIKSGFSYSYLSSTFNYEYVERTIATYTGMINAYIISPFNPPQQITFYGTRIDTLEMSYAFNHSKKFKYYNIPLTVNYYLPVKKFKLGAGAGIGFNLVTEVTGEYLQSDLKTESELNNNGQSPYKSSYRFYGIGNISVCFQLNKKIYLMAEPELRIPLSTITKTDAEIKQKINTLSLQTGVGINF